jgi:fumarylacetoacetate (FAA) hydrolase family protein
MSATPAAVDVSARSLLPEDAERALLVGRVWDAATGGPRPVRVHGQDVHDLFHVAPTVSDLTERADAAEVVAATGGTPRWRLDDLVEASLARDPARSHLLAPVDLHVVKACGVTFVDSMVERVIEERSDGDASRAAAVRERLASELHAELASVEPGSAAAEEVKRVLVAAGMWSPYLEVGLGPDPEVFTKAPVLSSVGYGARVGIPTFSSWNNPEPELVLVVDSRGRARGATLGNDVNLRDVEGRSALLLGMAKDNNASSALGPFVRLFDETFTLDTVRDERISLEVAGAADGYLLSGENNVGRLSRTFERLVEAAWGRHHQYPDGFVLYTGTLFAPTQDRDRPGAGFTHRPGDRVTISSAHLCRLVNDVGTAEDLPPWDFGVGSLLAYLRHQPSSPEE